MTEVPSKIGEIFCIFKAARHSAGREDRSEGERDVSRSSLTIFLPASMSNRYNVAVESAPDVVGVASEKPSKALRREFVECRQ